MPSDDVLQSLTKINFKNTLKDYSGYVSILEALGIRRGERLIDFGCSWGYGSWQLAKAGFLVTGFEISRSRCSYARDKLAIAATSNLAELGSRYDCFFSAHVIEHVPSALEMILLGKRLLRPGGLFVAFTPNGCFAKRERDYRGWHYTWGFVHPQLIDAEFFIEAVKPHAFLLASSPYDLELLRRWDGSKSEQSDLSGEELMLAFRPPN